MNNFDNVLNVGDPVSVLMHGTKQWARVNVTTLYQDSFAAGQFRRSYANENDTWVRGTHVNLQDSQSVIPDGFMLITKEWWLEKEERKKQDGYIIENYKNVLNALTGAFAAIEEYTVCEPIEGFAKRPQDIETCLKDLMKQVRKGQDNG